MKTKKIIILVTMIMMLLTTVCFAGDIDTDYFKPSDLTTDDYEGAFDVIDGMVYALRVVGIIISIGGLMIMGIKYMTGSLEEKAEYKTKMIPYVIGCVILFATSTIVNILYELGSNFNG